VRYICNAYEVVPTSSKHEIVEILNGILITFSARSLEKGIIAHSVCPKLTAFESTKDVLVVVTFQTMSDGLGRWFATGKKLLR
jgi:hypothetical protein